MLCVKHLNLLEQTEGDVREMYVTLSAERRAYVDLAKNDRTRTERIAAGYLVEAFLSENGYRGRMVKRPDGRPVYEPAEGEGELFLSVTHSYPLVYVAFCERPVGIDVEMYGRRDEGKIHGLMASRFFTENERAFMKEAARGTSEEIRGEERLFLSIWTFKEALCKALGMPLTEVLSSCDYTTYVSPGSETASVAGERFVLRRFEESGGIITVCIARG